MGQNGIQPGRTASDRSVEKYLAEAVRAAKASAAPFSGRPAAAVLVLPDGTWIPGVRVESASYSLRVEPVVNAFSTAVALGYTEVVAVVQSEPFTEAHGLYLAHTPYGRFERTGEAVAVAEGAPVVPSPAERVSPFIGGPASGIEVAREIARRAYVPESAFPVGCVLEFEDGRFLPGVNVEHPDWGNILCAERNALGTAASYGIGGARRLYLTCSAARTCSPCGACRQLLAELAPDVRVIMDRGGRDPIEAAARDLLPGAFAGDGLAQKT